MDDPKSQKITAAGFLHKDGKLFIAKRADSKKFLPGKFELPGGHIEHGEDIMTGLKREFKEELGVDVIIGNAFYTFTYMRGKDHTVEIDYFAELLDPDIDIRLNPEDHSECRWVDRNELDEVWDTHDVSYEAVKRGFELLKTYQLTKK